MPTYKLVRTGKNRAKWVLKGNLRRREPIPKSVTSLDIEYIPIKNIIYSDDMLRMRKKEHHITQLASLISKGYDIRYPIEVEEKHNPHLIYECLDGYHRIEACKRLGCQYIPARINKNLSIRERLKKIYDSNQHAEWEREDLAKLFHSFKNKGLSLSEIKRITKTKYTTNQVNYLIKLHEIKARYLRLPEDKRKKIGYVQLEKLLESKKSVDVELLWKFIEKTLDTERDISRKHPHLLNRMFNIMLKYCQFKKYIAFGNRMFKDVCPLGLLDSVDFNELIDEALNRIKYKSQFVIKLEDIGERHYMKLVSFANKHNISVHEAAVYVFLKGFDTVLGGT